MQLLLQGEAAVGGQNLAGDEIRIGGGQEADDFGHVFRSANPPQGRLLRQGCDGILPQGAEHVRINAARRHGVDPDTGGGQLSSQ